MTQAVPQKYIINCFGLTLECSSVVQVELSACIYIMVPEINGKDYCVCTVQQLHDAGMRHFVPVT